jgi:hypothetical protein
MNWNEWEMIWKRQELPRGAVVDLAKLRETFDLKSRQFARTLWLRDWLETGAGGVVLVFMAVIWWHQGRSGWPIGVAMALVTGVMAFFVRERCRARKARPAPDALLLVRLDADLAELRHQRHLLGTVASWYLVPLGMAIVLVSITLSRRQPAWNPAGSPIFLGAYLAFVAGLLVWVWWVNRRAVKQRVEPRLAELQKLRDELVGAGAGPN